jgi:hypothetical protein
MPVKGAVSLHFKIAISTHPPPPYANLSSQAAVETKSRDQKGSEWSDAAVYKLTTVSPGNAIKHTPQALG